LGLFPTTYIENGPCNWEQVFDSGAEQFKQKINDFKNKSLNNKVLLSIANGGPMMFDHINPTTCTWNSINGTTYVGLANNYISNVPHEHQMKMENNF